MKVLKRISGQKVAQDMTYESICNELGFISDVNFVKVTKNGYVGFWAGKRAEASALAYAIIDHDYYPTESLRRMFPALFNYAGF